MQEHIKRFDELNTRIVALTTDSPAKNLRVTRDLNLTIPILSDPQGDVLRKIEMWDARWKIASRGYYLLDAQRGVVAHYTGSWRASDNAVQFLLDKILNIEPAKSGDA